MLQVLHLLIKLTPPRNKIKAGSRSMMARVDRLDLVVGYLEEMRGSTSPLSSSAASTPPRSRGSCRPAKEALQEAQAKGSLVDRIALLESRVLKMEDGMEMSTSEMSRSPSRSSSNNGDKDAQGRNKKKKKKTTTGLKSLVKTCVRGNLKTKD